MTCSKTSFGFFTRRHHCRLCGCVTCYKCSGRRHPLIPKNRICHVCYSTVVFRACGLWDCEWYHGRISRAESERRLSGTDSQTFDFLVRESNTVNGFVAVSRRTANGVSHHLVFGKAGQWNLTRLNTTPFASIQDMIAFYMSTPVDSHIHLGRPAVAGAVIGPTECSTCHVVNDAGVLFCERCGTRIASSEQAIQEYRSLAE
eukprot:m.129019 g.129019  ORF g.129019 m.129019 type:complete len:202 (+) comp23619_c0_seq3:178-783(+)